MAQETFLRAYQALARGERWDNPRAWLYRVASRLATDDYRRARLLHWLPLGDVHASRADSESIESRVAEKVDVRAALNALSPKYRIPLVLYVYEERTVDQIAETMGLSNSAVKMRLSRAREMFRQAYQQEGA